MHCRGVYIIHENVLGYAFEGPNFRIFRMWVKLEIFQGLIHCPFAHLRFSCLPPSRGWPRLPIQANLTQVRRYLP